MSKLIFSISHDGWSNENFFGPEGNPHADHYDVQTLVQSSQNLMYVLQIRNPQQKQMESIEYVYKHFFFYRPQQEFWNSYSSCPLGSYLRKYWAWKCSKPNVTVVQQPSRDATDSDKHTCLVRFEVLMVLRTEIKSSGLWWYIVWKIQKMEVAGSS
jgi:hypothetical protein